jgi:hypothetical protein
MSVSRWKKAEREREIKWQLQKWLYKVLQGDLSHSLKNYATAANLCAQKSDSNFINWGTSGMWVTIHFLKFSPLRSRATSSSPSGAAAQSSMVDLNNAQLPRADRERERLPSRGAALLAFGVNSQLQKCVHCCT